jgi:2-polyprenyl-3-methyl-5-hydroxy-6-metoxy-1,4-benzoquinol methylase
MVLRDKSIIFSEDSSKHWRCVHRQKLKRLYNRVFMQSTEYWDNLFSRGKKCSYSRVEMPELNDPVLQRALEHFGTVENKVIIDLGCGRGATSLFFARCGANVISVDRSEIAIENLLEYCKKNSIYNIKPINISAHEISTLPKADYIFGSMILHHIEPFEEFLKTLRTAIKPGGKGFFWENNAQSKIMLWFRQNIVGKLWISKHGDKDEFPLTPEEVNELNKYFHVRIEYPTLLYFKLIALYLFRGHLVKPFQMLDSYFFKFPKFRKYSYRQYLFLS